MEPDARRWGVGGVSVKTAFLFPGQGSQRVGMGAEFRRSLRVAQELYDRASDILGYGLAEVCEQGPAEVLSRTVFTQPALYVTSCVALEAFRERTALEPYAVAGHSVGEYAALYAAGAVDFDEGLRLVQMRAELMDAAARARPGAMTAVIGLDIGAVEACCRDASSSGVVVVANDNCPGQVVISGELGAVAEAERLAKERGARRVVRLPVSGGFHSPLMDTAMNAMKARLASAEIRDPRVPVVSNVTADYCDTAGCLRENLGRQVGGGVRWRESMLRLAGDGVGLFIELGSGDVLTGLMKRMGVDVAAVAIQDVASLDTAVRRLAEYEEEGDTDET